ncbi:MAG: choice-of-anchor D domain-containing protein, partial [Desulfobacteraceae bacterium]|nr:choice-of-anchor D domain-containing protein [Desulfobacteraceae bacterium]
MKGDFIMKNLKWLSVLFCLFTALCLFPSRGKASCWTLQYSFQNGPNIYLNSVWGSSGSDVFAVGEDNSVWGSSDVFAVGSYGTILHYDGISWTDMSSDTSSHLNKVWGNSGSDVFAVGDNGTILHYDGSSWSGMDSGTFYDFRDVWGSSGSDVFAVGVTQENGELSGLILHYDGSSWSDMNVDSSYILYAGLSDSATDITITGMNFAPDTKVMIGDTVITDVTIISLTEIRATVPPGLEPGTYSITITNPDSAGAVAKDCFTITAAHEYPDISVSTSSHDFGTVNTDTPVKKTLTVSNNGSAVLETGTISITGTNADEFSIQNDNCSDQTISASGDCTFDVVFTPISEGAKSASVEIPSNDPDTTSLEASLDGTVIPGKEEPVCWTWMNPLPQGNQLDAIWGSSGSDIFAVGNGTVLHYDGNSWNTMYFNRLNLLTGVWGSSASDVFAVGASPKEGVILHYDGSSWADMNSGTTNYLNGIWGSSASDVFAVGHYGTILHYDGSSWTAMNSGTSDFLYSVWGASDSNIFAVGENGTILHYDGSSWTSMSSGTPNRLTDVWGSSGSDVFAVGHNGTILHYNGISWTAMDSGTSTLLADVWGSSGSDVFAVGWDDIILHYDGTSWTSTASQTAYHTGVWGSSDSDVFAVDMGGVILRYDGSSWNSMTSGISNSLFALWGSSESDIFAVSHGFVVETIMIMHYDGSSWTIMNSGIPGSLESVWGSSGSDVFAVGRDGMILHYDGSSWNTMASGIPNWLSAVWGSSGSDVFAVGRDGMILHYDGSSWITMDSGTSDSLTDVWGSSGTDVFAVGDNGTILHYDGSSWNTMNSGILNSIVSVWGSSGTDVFAMGYENPILHYDGSSWTTMNSGTSNLLYDVWGSSGSDVFIVGSGGTILHYDGSCPISIFSVIPATGTEDSTTDVTTITGMNFVSGAKVRIGDTDMADVTIVSLTEIRATVPSGLEPGTYSITVTNPDSASAVLKDCFTITAAPGYPDISVSTSSHDFGTVNTDTPVKKTLTVSNNGNAAIETGTISITGTNADEFSIQNDNCSDQTISASGDCTFDVVFTPISEGAKSASVEIPSDDPDATFLNVTLEGTVAHEYPDISVSTFFHDFG